MWRWSARSRNPQSHTKVSLKDLQWMELKRERRARIGVTTLGNIFSGKGMSFWHIFFVKGYKRIYMCIYIYVYIYRIPLQRTIRCWTDRDGWTATKGGWTTLHQRRNRLKLWRGRLNRKVQPPLNTGSTAFHQSRRRLNLEEGRLNHPVQPHSTREEAGWTSRKASWTAQFNRS